MNFTKPAIHLLIAASVSACSTASLTSIDLKLAQAEDSSSISGVTPPEHVFPDLDPRYTDGDRELRRHQGSLLIYSACLTNAGRWRIAPGICR